MSETKDFAGPSRPAIRAQTFASFGSEPSSPAIRQAQFFTNRTKHTDTQVTTDTQHTSCSSVIDPEWASQCILSLDGGGIRGYASLLILKRLMEIVGEIERRTPPTVPSEFENTVSSSYHPGEYRPCVNNMEEGKAKVKDPVNACRFIPCHYFDYIGGTSTGGLISIMLGRLRMGVDEALAEYETLGEEIFGHSRWFSYRGPFLWARGKYSGERMSRTINDVVLRRLSERQLDVGGDSFSSTPRLCKTICIAYKDKPLMAKNMATSGPYVFRSYDHWPQNPGAIDPLERNPGYAHTIPIDLVARATSAAPMYFDSVIIQNRKFGDGGFGTNNPAQEVMEEVIQMSNNNKDAVKVFVSVGTGLCEISRFSNKSFELLTWLNAAKKLATDSESKHESMLSSTKLSGIPYNRFNVGMQDKHMTKPKTVATSSASVVSNAGTAEDIRSADGDSKSSNEMTEKNRPKKATAKSKTTSRLGNMKLDEWKTEGGLTRRAEKDTTLQKIKDFTADYLNSPGVEDELGEVAQRLVDIRRQRSTSPLWKMVSTGLQYRCPVRGCEKGMKLRHCKINLRTHLVRKHGLVDDDELEVELRKGELPY